MDLSSPWIGPLPPALEGKVLTTREAPRIALNTTISTLICFLHHTEEAFSTFVRLSIMKMKSLY